MSSARDLIVDWAEQGRLKPESLPVALELAGVTPDAAAWRRFIARLLLSLGALLTAAGVIFFFAYNWDGIGRFGQFALVQGVLVVAVTGAWFYGPAKTAGQAALLLATLLTGALLALIGQTYQTGADPWQLFAWWAVLIVPWVVVARMPVLWLCVVALANLTLALYFRTFGGLFGLALADETFVWILFLFNGMVLAIWEVAARYTPWMQPRWTPRLLAVAVGTAITGLAVFAVVDRSGVGLVRVLVYVVWTAAMYAAYRRLHPDLFMLAGLVLSGLVVTAAALGRLLLDAGGSAGFLFIGLVVVGLSAAGATWLRRVAAESER